MKKVFYLSVLCILLSCSSDSDDNENQQEVNFDFSTILSIDFDNLSNYITNQPSYITKDNTTSNSITNEGATLGRILFYDTNLSSDNAVSCSSCHQQENAFSDLELTSQGVNGTTGRHSMRLINSRFSDESKFFWDERASSLEEQTTMPIQDHAEMGFSGTNGDEDINGLITKLSNTDYYPTLFEWVFGDDTITESRMQLAMAQFIRSIQSFDSKYDEGRVDAANEGQPFTNFTQNENNGKDLFLRPPTFDNNGNRTAGGLGCAGCHRPPEFDIDPNSLNNGFIHIIANTTDLDLEVTRSPTLRDILKQNGTLNGNLMHLGVNLDQVIAHYNNMLPSSDNANLDPRLKPGGNLQNLQMTNQEISDLKEFIQTLSGSDVYTNQKWSDPFL